MRLNAISCPETSVWSLFTLRGPSSSVSSSSNVSFGTGNGGACHPQKKYPDPHDGRVVPVGHPEPVRCRFLDNRHHGRRAGCFRSSSSSSYRSSTLLIGVSDSAAFISSIATIGRGRAGSRRGEWDVFTMSERFLIISASFFTPGNGAGPDCGFMWEAAFKSSLSVTWSSDTSARATRAWSISASGPLLSVLPGSFPGSGRIPVLQETGSASLWFHASCAR